MTLPLHWIGNVSKVLSESVIFRINLPQPHAVHLQSYNCISGQQQKTIRFAFRTRLNVSDLIHITYCNVPYLVSSFHELLIVEDHKTNVLIHWYDAHSSEY